MRAPWSRAGSPNGRSAPVRRYDARSRLIAGVGDERYCIVSRKARESRAFQQLSAQTERYPVGAVSGRAAKQGAPERRAAVLALGHQRVHDHEAYAGRDVRDAEARETALRLRGLRGGLLSGLRAALDRHRPLRLLPGKPGALHCACDTGSEGHHRQTVLRHREPALVLGEAVGARLSQARGEPAQRYRAQRDGVDDVVAVPSCVHDLAAFPLVVDLRDSRVERELSVHAASQPAGEAPIVRRAGALCECVVDHKFSFLPGRYPGDSSGIRTGPDGLRPLDPSRGGGGTSRRPARVDNPLAANCSRSVSSARSLAFASSITSKSRPGATSRTKYSNPIGSTRSACARSWGTTGRRSTRRPRWDLRSSTSRRGDE